MAIRLAMAPIAWTNNDLPELGGETPLEVCLAETRAAGFSGTETGVKFPMDPAVLKPILDGHGLQLVSGWFSGLLLERSVDQEMVRIEDQLNTFAAMGASALIYAETSGSVQGDQAAPLSGRPRLAAADFPAYGAKLTEVAERMAARGVPMTFHHHMGTVVETADEIDLLMANTGEAVGLLIDTGHLAYAGAAMGEVVRRHGHRVNHVHAKDIRTDVFARAKAQDMSFLGAILEGVFTVPGDGSLDFAEVAQALAEIGYARWVVVEAEQDPAKAPPAEYAKIGHRHLSQVFAAAGFDIVD